MTDTLNEKDLEAVREVISASRLRSIEYYEISARRYEDNLEPDERMDGHVNIDVMQRVTETGFGIRLNARVIVPQGEASASVAAEYDLDEEVSPKSRTLQLFANEVAVMSIFPYVREAISTCTARVFGRPLNLPVVERGEITMDVDDE